MGQITKINKQSKKKCQNRMKNDRVMLLKGRALKLQLAYVGPKIGYFGHIFKDIDHISIRVFSKVSVTQFCNFGYN